MSQYTEFEGKSVEKALESASKTLNLPVEKLQYDIISYGSSGIFGLVGIKKAKIRITTSDFKGGSQIQKEARSKARDLVKDAFEVEDDGEESAVSPTIEPASETVSVDLQAVAQHGEQALQKIIDFISEGSRVASQQTNGRITFNVEGGNSALLIGKRGQTLEALQYLVEKIINKQNDARIRVLVDVEGYLGARKDNLQRLAIKMAEKAQKTNKPVTIGQMNAYDRRIVHLHLKDNQAVRTQSVGDGYYRKLVIFPKRRRGKSSH
ncbi:MAG: Jag N-terminal domain-containing protein [Desulfobacteraceae bacterium]|nr:Jag N-terminal domain-containing protein [Desulfobacteraceae bacterium]